jgi:hypothetical protein
MLDGEVFVFGVGNRPRERVTRYGDAKNPVAAIASNTVLREFLQNSIPPRSGGLLATEEFQWWEVFLAFRFAARASAGLILAGISFVTSSNPTKVQDPFENHVYEYEELPSGGFTLEGDFNFTGTGTKSFDGTVAPMNHQFHMTGELTSGITTPRRRSKLSAKALAE